MRVARREREEEWGTVCGLFQLSADSRENGEATAGSPEGEGEEQSADCSNCLRVV